MLVTTQNLLGVWEALLYPSDLIHRPSASQLSLTPSSAVHNLTDICNNNNNKNKKTDRQLTLRQMPLSVSQSIRLSVCLYLCFGYVRSVYLLCLNK